MDEGFGSWADIAENSETVRILHVDDEAEFTELTAEFLERESDAFEVLSENSASAGLERLSSEAVDCIVSDYQMPGQNGLEFFDSLPESHSEVPFILFTGKGSEEVASDAFSTGVTDYLQKEVGTDQFTVLANRIEQAVSRFRYQRRVELTRRRFKTLVEESNDAILVVDRTGTILYATPATEHILGKPPDVLLGTDGFEPIHPDDVTAVGEELRLLLEDPAYRARVEFRYEHADGTWVWIGIRGRNLLDDPEITGIVVYVHDIDDRKTKELALERQEQKFRAVFEEAFDAMVITDDNGVCTDANPAACDLFGVAKDELLGRAIEEFTPEDDGSEAAWQDLQQSDHDWERLPLVRADGERRVVEFTATQGILPDRNLAVLRDVTEENQPETS